MAQYVLANDLASFTFEDHATTGLRLLHFNRDGGSSWSNSETKLWQAIVYDTTTAPTLTTATINPTAATLGAVAVTTDAQGELIQATWTAVPVGGDSLTVTLTLRLNTDEDFLRVRIAASWAAAAAYTLDSLQVLGLSIAPKNQGADYAVVPFGKGILSENPVHNLRYANGDAGFPVTGFGLSQDNRWTYPAGRGWGMACWGYYETTTDEGWMVYFEDHSLEFVHVTWQGDGTTLNWTCEQPQPDNVLVGNNSRTLGSGYSFCLRPFEITQVHGWWDIGKHYRDRLDATRPIFWTNKRHLRTDISDAERAYTPFISFQSNQETFTGASEIGDMQALLDSVRSNASLATSVAFAGIVQAPNFKLQEVGEDPLTNLQGQLATLYHAGNNYFGYWIAVDVESPNRGAIFPSFSTWDTNRWNATLAGDQAELRLWTAAGMFDTFRMSRAGYLQGGGITRLGEETLPYHRELSFGVSAYTGPTLTITVDGSPTGAGFTGTLYAALAPALAADRLAVARVTMLATDTIRLFTGMFNASGATAIPLAGDTVVLFDTRCDLEDQCWHAMVNSTEYMTRLKVNSALGVVDSFRACGHYHDTASEPLFNTSAALTSCYRDHSTWTKINAGYSRHPYGGGSWWVESKRAFWTDLLTAARSAQVALGRQSFYWPSGEDIDETVLDLIAWDWHGLAAGSLWRNTNGTDPSIHKYKAIPLFAVVHAGKSMGRPGLDQEFSSALLFTAHALTGIIDFLGYSTVSEYPYGVTWPVLSYFRDDGTTFQDFFSPGQYQDAGGSVPVQVRSIANLIKQTFYAESTWLFTAGFRYGDMLPPAETDLSLSGTTTGLAQDFWTALNPLVVTYDVLYPRATYPRVINSCWQNYEGKVLVLLTNWTNETARWQGEVNLTVAGFTGTRVRVREVDYANRTVTASQTYTGPVLTVGVNQVPAYSMRALILDEEPTLSFSSRAVLVRWTH